MLYLEQKRLLNPGTVYIAHQALAVRVSTDYLSSLYLEKIVNRQHMPLPVCTLPVKSNKTAVSSQNSSSGM